jgi:aspartate aminotransferase
MGFTSSHRVQQVKASPTLVVAEKAAQMRAAGKDVINLGVGEPDFDTPDYIKEAAIAALRAGFTKYTAVDGTPELKAAIQAKFKRDNQLQYSPEQILVSVGGKQSCYNLCQALLNKGDEVVILAPYWVSYPDMVLLAEGVPVFIDSLPQTRYKITPEALAKAITSRTKLVILNSPANPSGVAYSLEELKALGYPH